jgi:putative ABC transport system permease protein
MRKHRSRGVGIVVDSAWRGVRFAGRRLLRQARFTMLVAVVLGVTIGATTAVFSVVSSVLFAPLPYAESDRLVSVWSVQPQNALQQRASYPDFQDWRAAARALDLVGHGNFEPILTGTADPERLQAKLFVGDLLRLLGVPPLLGSPAPAAGTAVLSYGLWQRQFGGDRSIVGKALTLDGTSYVIAGVMPAGFEFPPRTTTRADLWLPLERFNPALAEQRGARLIEVTGRLRGGATLAEAQAELDVIAANLAAQYPATNRGVGVRLVPALDEAVGFASRGLLLLGAAVGALLLIGCCNVANLLLARTLAREKELATRAALGASRRRIAGELALESLLLSIIGGALGTLLAIASVGALGALLADVVPRAGEIRVNGTMLGIAAALSIGAGVLFGVLPAARGGKLAASSGLSLGAQTASRDARGTRMAAMLVAGQMALATVLLAGAGAFVHSFAQLARRDAGFDPANVLTFELTWPAARYADPAQPFGELRRRLLEIPGVVAASTGVQLPQRGDSLLSDTAPFAEIEGQATPAVRPRVATLNVQPGYLRALGIPLLGGRDFGDEDAAVGSRVALVNAAFARAYLAGDDPVGRRVRLDSWALRGEASAEIVGVAGDVEHRGLNTDAEPLLYFPFAQRPTWSATMVVKTEGEPLSYLPAVRAAVRAIDGDQPLDNVLTLEQRLAGSLAADRLRALLLGGFSVLALALAAIGLFAVLSYTTERRARELGIRMALGARERSMAFAVIAQGLQPTLGGMLLGLVVAGAAFRLVRPLLFAVGSADLMALAVATVVLLTVAAVACAIPARRAARTNLVAVLRSE